MLNRGRTLIALGCLLILGACNKPSVPACIGERLEPGREISRRIWGARCDFRFQGKAGEVITLKIISKTPGLDPWVQLFDPEGRKEASDDDSGGKGNPLIAGHVLKRSGLYTAGIGSADKRSGELSILYIQMKGSEAAGAKAPAHGGREVLQLQEPSRRDKGGQPRISILGAGGTHRQDQVLKPPGEI